MSTQLNNGQILSILTLSEDATALYTSGDVVIEFANEAMLASWGKDQSIIGQPLATGVPELVGQPFIGILREIWLTGKSVIGKEAPAVTRINGQLETNYYDYHYRAILNDDGTMLCILHTAANVTERVNSRKALEAGAAREIELNEQLSRSNAQLVNTNKELSDINETLLHSYNQLQHLNDSLKASEERFRYLIDRAPVAICILREPELYVETINEAMLTLIGKSRDIIGKTFREGVPELKDQGYLELMEEVYRTGRGYAQDEAEAQLVVNGKLVTGYYNYIYQPIYNDQYETNAIMLVAHDVTEQVNARQKLQKAEEGLRLATDSAELGTWDYDPVTHELVTSVRFRQILGLDPGVSPGIEQVMAGIIDEHRQSIRLSIADSILRTGKLAVEYPVIRADNGKTRWVRSVGRQPLETEGLDRHYTGVILDITEQKLDEIRKNDFIAMVSHELKTPLTSLKGYTQLLLNKDGTATDEFVKFALGKVDQQAQKMTSLINGFLNISRLDAGKIQLNKTRYSLNELIKSVVEEFSIFTQNNNLILVHVSDPFEIEADEEKIGQVINNFLSNAIKYGGIGNPVEISCEHANGKAKVLVADKGPGIAPVDVDRLFERYYRVETKQNKTVPGFGIGLYLCREIIQRHQGEIGVNSVPGRGSEFWFEIPVR